MGSWVIIPQLLPEGLAVDKQHSAEDIVKKKLKKNFSCTQNVDKAPLKKVSLKKTKHDYCYKFH